MGEGRSLICDEKAATSAFTFLIKKFLITLIYVCASVCDVCSVCVCVQVVVTQWERNLGRPRATQRMRDRYAIQTELMRGGSVNYFSLADKPLCRHK